MILVSCIWILLLITIYLSLIYTVSVEEKWDTCKLWQKKILRSQIQNPETWLKHEDVRIQYRTIKCKTKTAHKKLKHLHTWTPTKNQDWCKVLQKGKYVLLCCGIHHISNIRTCLRRKFDKMSFDKILRKSVTRFHFHFNSILWIDIKKRFSDCNISLFTDNNWC